MFVLIPDDIGLDKDNNQDEARASPIDLQNLIDVDLIKYQSYDEQLDYSNHQDTSHAYNDVDDSSNLDGDLLAVE